MRNKIEDLRNHLFEALENLKDCEPEKLQEQLERSRAIADISKVIVDSAKVEVDFVKATGGEVITTEFFNENNKLLK